MSKVIKELFSNSPEPDIKHYLENLSLSNQKKLEVGVNKGFKTRYLARSDGFLCGVDIEIKTDMQYDFLMIRGNGYNLPFREESFDFVCSFDVIEHVHDEELFLREQVRVLKKKGRLVCGTPNVKRFANLIRGISYPRSFPLILGPDCVHLREYSLLSLERLFLNLDVCEFKMSCFFIGLAGIAGLRRFPRALDCYAHYLILECMKN